MVSDSFILYILTNIIIVFSSNICIRVGLRFCGLGVTKLLKTFAYLLVLYDNNVGTMIFISVCMSVTDLSPSPPCNVLLFTSCYNF